MITVEHHTNFLVTELGGVKSRDAREQYEQRTLLVRSDAAILGTEVPGPFLDLLKRTGIGPRRIIESAGDRYETLTQGRAADLARKHGVSVFWFGAEEHRAFEALGIAGWLTPERMDAINCKVILRKRAQGINPLAVPEHRVVSDRAGVHNACRELSVFLRQDHPVPDALIAKRPRLLSGAGMRFILEPADAELFCEEHVNGNGEPIIVEHAWRDHVPVSAHWNVTRCGPVWAGASVMFVENGMNHVGNIISKNDQDLPGLTRSDLLTMQSLSCPFAWDLYHAGFRGRAGYDLIKVRGLCGKRRMYIVEPNVYRPPAPRYLFGLAATLRGRLGAAWTIGMAEVHAMPGAASTFEQVWKLLKRTPMGNLQFNGCTGVIPMLTGLLPKKFVAVCVGGNARGMFRQLENTRRLVGEETVL